MRAGWAGTEWRVAARLARRELRRRPGRAALVLLLIGLPVAGMTLYMIGARTTTPTAAQSRQWRLGQADDVVHVWGGDVPTPPAFEEALAAAYPPDAHFVVYAQARDAATRVDGHLEGITVTDQPLDDPLVSETMPLQEGRWPRSGDEVAVDLTLAELTDATIGSTIELYLLGDKQVVGIVVDPTCVSSCPTAVTSEPLTLPVSARHAFVDVPGAFTPANPAVLGTVNAQAEIYSNGTQPTWDAPLRDRQWGVYMIGGVVLAVATVITVAAFAVAARRQLRMLGLLSASGVPPHGLRRVVLLQGTCAGVVGAGLGALLGLGLARALSPLFDDVSERYVTGLDVHPLDLLGPFVLGVVAATAAAWWPARAVERIPTLAALAGRQPQDRGPARRPVGGVVLMGLGIAGLAFRLAPGDAWSGWIGAVSAISLLVGAVATAPWLVAHADPLSRRLRGGARVALRDLARQRVRSGAAIAAIMAPAGVLALIVTNSATQDARNRAAYELETETPYQLQANQVALEPPGGWATGERAPEAQRAELAEILPDAVVVDIEVVLPQQPTSTGFPGATVRIVDPATGVAVQEGTDGAGRYLVTLDPGLVAASGGEPELVDALEQGKIVVTGLPVANPTFVLDGITAAVDVPSDVVVIDGLRGGRLNQIAMVSPETVSAWGASTIYYGSLYATPDTLTETQRDQILAMTAPDDGCDGVSEAASCRDQQIIAELTGELPAGTGTWWPRLRDAPVSLGGDQLARYGYTAALLVFTLLVLAIVLALAAAESRDERALLDAVGAPPSIRRSITAWQALMLPAFALVAAIPGGVLVARAADPYGWEAPGPFVVPLAGAGGVRPGRPAGGRGRGLAGDQRVRAAAAGSVRPGARGGLTLGKPVLVP